MPDTAVARLPPAVGWPASGTPLASRLAKLDLHRLDDLILHLPLRYEDETRLTPIAVARPGLILVP